MTTRKFAIAAFAAATTLAATLASGAAQARGPVDVQWQVTIGSQGGGYPAHGPAYYPQPVYQQVPVYRTAPVYLPAPVVVLPGRGYWHGPAYREPQRWDVDGDGIPNRHDRVYNPRWDRDGDGIPNRYDRDPRHGHGHHDRDQRDDRRDDRDDRGGRGGRYQDRQR